MSSDNPGTARGRGIPLGRFRGVPVVLSPSWFVIALVITIGYGGFLVDRGRYEPALAYAAGFLFAVLLAASVLAHELAHTAASRSLGIPVRSVTLFLLGGVSETTREPTRPTDEYVLAVVGPLVSLVIGATAAGALVLTDPPGIAAELLVQVAAANAVVGLYNLLPGLPLDGGRMVRAWVWHLRGDRTVATVAAGTAGKVVALLTLAVAFFLSVSGGPGSLLNLLIGLLLATFIWVGADASVRAARVDSRQTRLDPARLVRPTLLVAPELSVGEAVRRAHETGARAIVVVNGYGAPVAVVREDAVARTPEDRRPWLPVTSVAQPVAPDAVLPEGIDGAGLVAAMRRRMLTEYLVVRPDGGVVGVIASVDVGDALRGARR